MCRLTPALNTEIGGCAMRKSIVIAGLVLAVGILAPAGAVAKAHETNRPHECHGNHWNHGKYRPYKVSLWGTTVFTPPSTVVFDGTSLGTHIGKGTVHTDGQLTFTGPTAFDYASTTVTTAANGDKLFSEENGVGAIRPDGSGNDIPVTSTITGGTGRFAGASGIVKGTIHNDLNPDGTYQSTYRGVGKISY